MSKIKEIKGIIQPETIDYLVTSESERQKIAEKFTDLVFTAISKNTEWELISNSLKRNIIAGVQYMILDNVMQSLKKKNNKYYNTLMKSLNDKKENTEIDVDYLEKICPFMHAIENSSKMYKQ